MPHKSGYPKRGQRTAKSNTKRKAAPKKMTGKKRNAKI